MNNGKLSKGSVTFEEFATNWLTTKKRNTLKPSSYMRKEGIFRNQVFPILGAMPIEEISHADVQNMINTLTDSGLSYSTVKKAYEAVYGCLREYRIRTLLALGFQAFLIIVCVAIYAILVQRISLDADVSAAIWTCMGYTVLLCFCLFKTSSLARSVFRAH